MKSFGELGRIDMCAICAFIGCIVMLVGALSYVGMIPGGDQMVWVFACGFVVTAVSCAVFYIERWAQTRDSEE